jgi:chromatin remodeling complex protein RSC6
MSTETVPQNEQVVESVAATEPAIKTEREIQIESLMVTLSTFKTQITAMQQQVRLLEKTINKEVKTLQKVASKNKNKGNRKPSGFAKSSKISDTLCQFMNKPTGTEMARTEVTKYIIGYIKEKGLQQETNKKFIKPDTALCELLGVGETDEVTYFNIQKYMNKHFNSASSQSAGNTEVSATA